MPHRMLTVRMRNRTYKKKKTNKQTTQIENKNDFCSENDDNGMVVRFMCTCFIIFFLHQSQQQHTTYHHLVLSFIHFSVVMCRVHRKTSTSFVFFTRHIHISSTQLRGRQIGIVLSNKSKAKARAII